MPDIFWDAISQRAFELRPDKFIRVKLRSISWKAVHVQALRLLDKLFNCCSFMDGATVPQKDNWPSKVSQQMPEEYKSLFHFDVLADMEANVESRALSFWRNAERRNGRDFSPPASHPKRRCLSLWCPCFDDGWDKKKSALIQKSQMGSKLVGLFLYGATRVLSNSVFPLLSSLSPSWLVFDNSSPDCSSDTTDLRWSSECQNFSGLSDQCASVSIRPFGIRPLRRLWPRYSTVSFSCQVLMRKAAQVAVWALNLLFRLSCRLVANAQWNLGMHVAWQPPCGVVDRTRVDGWHEASVFPMPLAFHGVS